MKVDSKVDKEFTLKLSEEELSRFIASLKHAEDKLYGYDHGNSLVCQIDGIRFKATKDNHSKILTQLLDLWKNI